MFLKESRKGGAIMIFEDIHALQNFAMKQNKETLNVLIHIKRNITGKEYIKNGTYVNKYCDTGLVYVIYPYDDEVLYFEI